MMNGTMKCFCGVLCVICTASNVSAIHWAGTFEKETLYLELDSDTNGITEDSSDLGNDGTLSGFGAEKWVEGIVGNGLLFGSYEQQVEIADMPVFESEGTVMFWYKATDWEASSTTPAKYPSFIGQGACSCWPAAANELWNIFLVPGALRFTIKLEDGSSGSVSLTTLPSDGEFHHYAMVFDTDNMWVYLDGEQIGTSALAYPISQESTLKTIYINKHIINQETMKGIMDEVRLINGAMTQKQIQIAIDKDLLIAHWPMDYSSNGIKDISKYGQHGTIYGNPSLVDTAAINNSLNFPTLESGSDYIDFGSNVPIFTKKGDRATGSIAFWFKRNGSYRSDSYPTIIGRGACYTTADHTTESWNIWIGSGPRIQFDFKDENGASQLPNANGVRITSLPDNDDWHHYAFTFDGYYVKAYLDGTQVDSRSQTSTIVDQAGKSLFIGRWKSPYGNIDDVRIYNKALSSTEISVLVDMADEDNLLYADGNASSNGNGTSWSDAINMLDTLENSLSAGKTAYVRGTFSGSNGTFYPMACGTESSPITILGVLDSSLARPMIYSAATGNPFRINGTCDYYIIKGLDFKCTSTELPISSNGLYPYVGGYQESAYDTVILSKGNAARGPEYITFEDCRLYNAGMVNISDDDPPVSTDKALLELYYASHVTVKNCEFHTETSTTWRDITATLGRRGILIGSSSDNVIADCYIEGFCCPGPTGLDGSTAGVGITCYGGCAQDEYDNWYPVPTSNNLIIRCYAENIHFYAFGVTGQRGYVTNNVFKDCESHMLWNTASSNYHFGLTDAYAIHVNEMYVPTMNSLNTVINGRGYGGKWGVMIDGLPDCYAYNTEMYGSTVSGEQSEAAFAVRERSVYCTAELYYSNCEGDENFTYEFYNYTPSESIIEEIEE